LSTQQTSVGDGPDLQLEIAHLLLIDVVGYSKLLVIEQIEFLQELNQIVRSTECFRTAETKGRLIRAARIPGDLNYGYLRLHPFCDPLRGDPRFEKIVASLAPDAKKP